MATHERRNFGTPVLVNGREVPIVGRVAMDMICVDLGPNAQDNAAERRCVKRGEGCAVLIAADRGSTELHARANQGWR